MLASKPTQITGARFLAERRYALLADLPRVGKTGSAITAADLVMAQSICVVTTASGRGVWRRGFDDWSHLGRKVQVLEGGAKLRDDTDVAIVSWNGLTQAKTRSQLLARQWGLVIADEAHAAKNFATKRTQALYGVIDRDGDLDSTVALFGRTGRFWALTGTPLPNCPLDVYPMMRALCPERLYNDYSNGYANSVLALDDFTKRYCIMRPMKIGHGYYAKRIDVFVEGRNLDELRARLNGFYLQRTQQDVGILEPEYEIMPLDGAAVGHVLPTAEFGFDRRKVLDAAKAGDTKSLEMHLGPLRRLTGEIKAHAVVEAVKEEFDAGLDKIVLAYWHKDVGRILADGLHKFGVVMLDGSTPPHIRSAAEGAFLHNPKTRVFLGQIQAAGEAIDLSSSKHLVFVETSFTPKDQLQMALRVCNYGQKQRPLVRVAALEGSIDDALQQILLRKWSAIKEVLR